MPPPLDDPARPGGGLPREPSSKQARQQGAKGGWAMLDVPDPGFCVIRGMNQTEPSNFERIGARRTQLGLYSARCRAPGPGTKLQHDPPFAGGSQLHQPRTRPCLRSTAGEDAQ